MLRKTFCEAERTLLLGVKGVGPSVVQRLEEIGISTLEELRQHDSKDITTMVASLLGSTCWKNSPQARQAIDLAIRMADEFMLAKKGDC